MSEPTTWTMSPAEVAFWDDFPLRLRIAVDALGGDRTLDQAPCLGCPAILSHRANAALTDTSWVGAVPAMTAAQRYDRLEALQRTDISAYSRAQAHLDLFGVLPGEHVCQPNMTRLVSMLDPDSRYAHALNAVRSAADQVRAEHPAERVR